MFFTGCDDLIPALSCALRGNSRTIQRCFCLTDSLRSDCATSRRAEHRKAPERAVEQLGFETLLCWSLIITVP